MAMHTVLSIIIIIIIIINITWASATPFPILATPANVDKEDSLFFRHRRCDLGSDH